jgi:PIN domain nuclease of toxin-antitoxin system
MRLLLDTHTFVWAVTTPDELSGHVRELIENPSNELFVSAASAWEISTKHRLGKFPQAEAIIRGFSFAIERLRSNELSISVEHALTAGDFDQPHRDPFDRMLAAQAVVEGATLITRDAALAQFPINIEW